jgi:hypothetical protein
MVASNLNPSALSRCMPFFALKFSCGRWLASIGNTPQFRSERVIVGPARDDVNHLVEHFCLKVLCIFSNMDGSCVDVAVAIRTRAAVLPYRESRQLTVEVASVEIFKDSLG